MPLLPHHMYDVMRAPKKKAKAKPVKKKRCAKVKLTVSAKEAGRKFLKALRKKRRANRLAESKNGKAAVLTPLEPPEDSSWLWPDLTNRQ